MKTLTTYFAFLLLAFGLSACMKKSTIGTKGLQSNIQNPATPTTECPGGLRYQVEAYSSSSTLPKVFTASSYVSFRIQADGCLYGVRVQDNGALLGVPVNSSYTSQVTWASKQMPSNSPLYNQTTGFTLQVLDASQNPVRTFLVNSDPYNIVAAATPSCVVSPSTFYVSPRNLGAGTFTVNSNVDGRITRVVSPDSSFLLPNSSQTFPVQVAANQISPSINLNFYPKSGELDFYVAPTAGGSEIKCDGGNVVYSVCGNNISGDFDGDGVSDTLNRDCGSGYFWVSSSTFSGYKSFGVLPPTENYDQILSGRPALGNYDNILLVRTATSGTTRTQNFKIGVSNGSAFSFYDCPISDGTTVMTDIVVDDPTSVTKIMGWSGSVYMYRTLAASSTGCSLGPATQQSTSVSINASPNPVPANTSTVITWGVTNLLGGSCSVLKCPVAVVANDTNCTSVSGQQNISTGSGSILNRRFNSDPISGSWRYKAKCTGSGSSVTSNEVTVTNPGGDSSFSIKLTQSGSPLSIPAFIRPQYADGTNVSSQSATPLYFDWNVPGATSCALTKLPLGSSVASTVRDNAIASVTNISDTVTVSSAYTLTCQTPNNSTPTYSSTLQVNVGGCPYVIGDPGAHLVTFSNAKPNATTAAKQLIIGAIPNRGKIKIFKVVPVSSVVAFDPFSTTAASNVSPRFTVSGCENAVVAPGGSTCTVNVAYKAQGTNTSANAELIVVYQRYNGDVGPNAGVSNIVTGYEADSVAQVRGTTRAQVCDRKGRNCH